MTKEFTVYGRPVSAYFSSVLMTPVWIWRLFLVAENPLDILIHYIKRTSPGRIKLRSGHTIILGAHPHDVITFFVIFAKRDYGKIEKNSTVVDIGGNIGIFSLYAAINGAKIVYAFEPSSYSAAAFQRNVNVNGFQDRIILSNCAVSATSGETINIPVGSSPYNQIKTGRPQAAAIKLTEAPTTTESEGVTTVALSDFVTAHDLPRISLLKMDCEGSEYEIIPSLGPDMLARIDEIRMECHGDQKTLIDGFQMEVFEVTKSRGSDLWLRRRGAVA